VVRLLLLLMMLTSMWVFFVHALAPGSSNTQKILLSNEKHTQMPVSADVLNRNICGSIVLAWRTLARKRAGGGWEQRISL
jgi:hypothetical protein